MYFFGMPLNLNRFSDILNEFLNGRGRITVLYILVTKHVVQYFE